jgi:integrase
LVLTNGVGGLVEPRTLSRAWEEWAKAAGVEDTGTHLGRHYAATSLLASGAASVADVAALLGHDPAVLLNTYATAVAAGQRAAVDVLGASLTAPVPAPIDPQNGATEVDGSGLAEGVS